MHPVDCPDCLCIETYSKNFVGFHYVPNAVLYDLVLCIQSEWPPGITGISQTVYSVISDYDIDIEGMRILKAKDITDGHRFVQLKGNPWSQIQDEEMWGLGDMANSDEEDSGNAENLMLGLIACLARGQFKLQISINMDRETRVFFFIKDPDGCKEIRVPTFCGVGLGEKNGLYVYQPTITRTKKSFFKSR